MNKRLNIIFLFFILSFSAKSQILYVDASRSPSGNGSSWNSSITTLKEALDIANANTNIIEIKVAGGWYYPSGYAYLLDRNATFLIARPNLKIEGGYPPGGGVRDLEKHHTILSGDLGRLNDLSDNSHHVMTVINLSESNDRVIIDGLHFYHGNANGGDSEYTYNGNKVRKNTGGGLVIMNNKSDVVVQNCTISANFASDAGAGLFIYASSSTIINTVFTGNSADYGGAAMNANKSTTEYINCTIVANRAREGGNSGGGMRNSNSTATIKNSIIWGNSSAVSNSNGGNASYSYSLVQGSNTTNDNNIAANIIDETTLFESMPTLPQARGSVPILDGSTKLKAGSPVINKGLNSYLTSRAITLDVQGKNRFRCVVDLGAHEFQWEMIEIISQPNDILACVMESRTFKVEARGAVSYQWQIYIPQQGAYNDLTNGSFYSGVKSATLSIINPSVAMEGRIFRCVIKGEGCQPDQYTKDVSIKFTNRRYVRIGSRGTGTSWDDASGDLQATLLDVCEGGEVWVSAGNYKATRPINDLSTQGFDRENAFIVKKGVKVYGGFSRNGSPTMEQRRPDLYETILSGVQSGNIKSYHVLITTDNVVIDGFTIENGHANGVRNVSIPMLDNLSLSSSEGAGIYNVGKNVLITNTTIQNNLAQLGGGVYNAGGADIKITNSAFLNNQAYENGGAIANISATVNLQNVSFSSNTALSNNRETKGGAIYAQSAKTTLSQSSFIGNESQKGGAIYLKQSSETFIINNFFDRNTSEFTGGAIHNELSSPQIISNLFIRNEAREAGAGVFNYTSSPRIINCTFHNNMRKKEKDDVSNEQSSHPFIINTIFSNRVWNDASSQPNITYSIMPGGYEGVGNIDYAATYQSHGVDNFRLAACSWPINGGSPDTTGLNLPVTDYEGNSRVNFGRIDMGVYESMGSIQTARPADNATVRQIQWTNGTTHYPDGCNNILASVKGIGTTNPVSGNMSVSVNVARNLLPRFVGRKYEITPSVNANTATASVTLYYTQAEFDAYNNASGNTIKLPSSPTDEAGKQNIIIRKENDTETIDITPTSVIWNATASRWDVSFDVTGFSTFYVLAAANNPLPLTLLSFTVKEENCNALLQWSTADEQNVSHFEIEESIDGSSFRPAGGISSIPAQNTLVKNNYTTVVYLNSTVAYYRLKMVDIDGQYTYSNIVILNAECSKLNAKIYPNPVKDKIYIQGINAGDKYRLINSNGQLVLSGIATRVTQEINTTSLTAGLYILHIVGKDERAQQIKLIKE